MLDVQALRFWTSKNLGSGRPTPEVLDVPHVLLWTSNTWGSGQPAWGYGRLEPRVLDVQAPEVLDIRNLRLRTSNTLRFWTSRMMYSGRPTPEVLDGQQGVMDAQNLGFWASRRLRFWTSETSGSGRPAPLAGRPMSLPDVPQLSLDVQPTCWTSARLIIGRPTTFKLLGVQQGVLGVHNRRPHFPCQ